MSTNANNSGKSTYTTKLAGINQSFRQFSRQITAAIVTANTIAVNIPIRSIYFNGTIKITGSKAI